MYSTISDFVSRRVPKNLGSDAFPRRDRILDPVRRASAALPEMVLRACSVGAGSSSCSPKMDDEISDGFYPLPAPGFLSDAKISANRKKCPTETRRLIIPIASMPKFAPMKNQNETASIPTPTSREYPFSALSIIAVPFSSEELNNKVIQLSPNHNHRLPSRQLKLSQAPM